MVLFPVPATPSRATNVAWEKQETAGSPATGAAALGPPLTPPAPSLSIFISGVSRTEGEHLSPPPPPPLHDREKPKEGEETRPVWGPVPGWQALEPVCGPEFAQLEIPRLLSGPSDWRTPLKTSPGRKRPGMGWGWVKCATPSPGAITGDLGAIPPHPGLRHLPCGLRARSEPGVRSPPCFGKRDVGREAPTPGAPGSCSIRAPSPAGSAGPGICPPGPPWSAAPPPPPAHPAGARAPNVPGWGVEGLGTSETARAEGGQRGQQLPFFRRSAGKTAGGGRGRPLLHSARRLPGLGGRRASARPSVSINQAAGRLLISSGGKE